jgi:hypothetical protein
LVTGRTSYVPPSDGYNGQDAAAIDLTDDVFVQITHDSTTTYLPLFY